MWVYSVPANRTELMFPAACRISYLALPPRPKAVELAQANPIRFAGQVLVVHVVVDRKYRQCSCGYFDCSIHPGIWCRAALAYQGRWRPSGSWN